MSRVFRLYLDESGDHSYGKRELRKLQVETKDASGNELVNYYPELEKDDKRYLGLTGCIIEKERYRVCFYPKLEELKQKYFPHSPDDPVILHRRDIIDRHGPFWRLRGPQRQRAFDEDLLSFFEEMEYTIITVVIDKKAHIERYREFAFHPYHYCLAAIIERYCAFLHFLGGSGDVLAESRGRREDMQLKEAYTGIYNSGTQFRPPDFFRAVLTSRELKLKPKKANIAGLQIADLLAYSSKRDVLLENGRLPEFREESFRKKVCEIIKGKYNRNFSTEDVCGYGKVFLK